MTDSLKKLLSGDEKALDNHLRLLRSIGVSGEDLYYYETPEQCFSDYIPLRKSKMTLLICENKDIWFEFLLWLISDSFRKNTIPYV